MHFHHIHSFINYEKIIYNLHSLGFLLWLRMLSFLLPQRWVLYEEQAIHGEIFGTLAAAAVSEELEPISSVYYSRNSRYHYQFFMVNMWLSSPICPKFPLQFYHYPFFICRKLHTTLMWAGNRRKSIGSRLVTTFLHHYLELKEQTKKKNH